MTIPRPASRSQPGVLRSIAVDVKAAEICDAVWVRLRDFTSPAIAAACGAAADVPKNGSKGVPVRLVVTPSAAVTSGFCSTTPPLDDTFPGVSAAPDAV